MSNSSVGQTYQDIVEDTIRASQQDFIDAGVSLDYLEALQQIWKNKLTHSKVAAFPWARQPSPEPPPRELSPQATSSGKPTPGAPPAPHYHNPAMAALRAMQQIQNHVATTPDASNGAATVVNRLAAIARDEDERYKQQEALRRLKEDEESRLREVKREDDLFGDDDSEYSGTFSKGKRDISQVDSPEEANRAAPSFVAGSLLSGTPPVDPDSDIDAPHDSDSPRNNFLDSSHVITPQSNQKKPKKEIDPLDDTINSDLDDSDIESDVDSEFGEGDEGDEGGADKSIVLCMYEKVHRTKNKWKCQLKDGVISIGGKDWVFSKANGEFEW